MKIALFLLAALALAGCVSTDYVGKSYPATTKVDVYFDAADVGRKYEVMGEMTAEAEFNSSEDMQEKIVEEAMAKGADAVIIGGLQKVVKGETASSDTKTKDGGKRSTSTTTTSYDEKKVIKARLIKYKKRS